MTPSVGRIVHYVSRGSADGVFLPVCRAAIVTDVDAGGVSNAVSLAVLNPTGMYFDQGITQSENGREGGTWHWPERV